MKKLPTLHILNGDAIIPAFKMADLPGKVLVWREILASGPAVYSMPREAFWQLRQRYITDTFQVKAEDYQEKVLNELPKLENASHYFEVVLWFDQDLTCQINLLYLLHMLSKQQPAVVSVCSSPWGCTGFKKHEELQHMFEHRQMMEASQLEQASALWQLYAGPDPLALQAYIREIEILPEQLKKALKLHLQRFPDQNAYLGKPQELLLNAVEGGTSTITEVQQKFWQQAPGYGYGDWQLQALLKELSPELVALSDEEINLTETGKQVLTGKAKFRKDLTYWLGGVQLNQQNPDFCRDSSKEQLKFCPGKPS